ncbi:hypothetical protein EV426DRAFT_679878 [Tirmania nivea]|nr:hypothetical protein EV426DRAFT_679878 [Tirmania nivea]
MLLCWVMLGMLLAMPRMLLPLGVLGMLAKHATTHAVLGYAGYAASYAGLLLRAVCWVNNSSVNNAGIWVSPYLIRLYLSIRNNPRTTTEHPPTRKWIVFL